MSHVVVITGMHRSGTSLVSSLLQRAGIHIGEKLLAANSANPRGYFEDVGFYEFHELLLHQRKQTYLYVDGNFTFEPTDAERERACQLIAERSHRSRWGWKDPRTALFLDFWEKLLPAGRFLFVYRHPIEVLLSLLRRGEFDRHPSLMMGLHAWYIYNSHIKSFCDRHPDRCLLVHIDGVVRHSTRFSYLLQEKLKLGFGLETEAFHQIYQVNELQITPFSPALTATLRKLFPGSLELYEQLNRQADLSGNGCQSESDASPHLSPLADFIESLDEPIGLPIKHSLLQMLISAIAPELTERMLARFDHSSRETQQRVDQLWMQVQQLQRRIAEQGQELNRDAARIESLTAALKRDAARIESLVAELNSIHDTRVWKAMQSYRNFKARWKKAA
jgi:hypothetical protein